MTLEEQILAEISKCDAEIASTHGTDCQPLHRCIESIRALVEAKRAARDLDEESE